MSRRLWKTGIPYRTETRIVYELEYKISGLAYTRVNDSGKLVDVF